MWRRSSWSETIVQRDGEMKGQVAPVCPSLDDDVALFQLRGELAALQIVRHREGQDWSAQRPLDRADHFDPKLHSLQQRAVANANSNVAR